MLLLMIVRKRRAITIMMFMTLMKDKMLKMMMPV
jgi:hypothetical protein